MADNDVDHDLLAFMREALSGGNPLKAAPAPPKTHVLESAQYIVDNSIDIFLSRDHIMAAAQKIFTGMKKNEYGTGTWSTHELHPKAKDASTVDFIFTMDLLNFSFWSDLPEKEGYAVEYKGKRWTGYWSLVAALQRALDEGIPITSPYFWADSELCTDDVLRSVFRSATDEEMPMLKERIECLREAGEILCERYDGKFTNMIECADQSAAALVLALADDFPCFRDEHDFERRRVNIYKRAQILVADLWACFDGESYGTFHDIDNITMFADYRVPVILHSLHCIQYSPKLEAHIKDKKDIPSGSSWELQLRGATIWTVECIRREIKRLHPESKINAILIDFYLYDTAKEMQRIGVDMIPQHRCRSIWY
ncbi:hypothetical protein EX30DRAFT_184669 [Ascodesmis nigricans]|uniref:Queuosine 5'-phosphate N-glycosylase/hydrolase n=1 Tax=Ascodesmis nigricans TaxID=341454 RepID=A0A4S2N079_9PEZI|nr:hypothetical protein EX30DRAFT_184669 [Ascodesmis nigricans]